MQAQAIGDQALNVRFLISAVGGAAIALVSTIASLWIAGRRERQKQFEERDYRRKDLLRTNLARLLELIQLRSTELEVRSDTTIPLAATLAAGTAMPWKHDDDALTSNSLAHARALILLYFPEFLDDLLALARADQACTRFIADEMLKATQNPRGWLSAANTYPDRWSQQFRGYMDKQADIEAKIGKFMQEQLLP
jgi:hypothetical protein